MQSLLRRSTIAILIPLVLWLPALAAAQDYHVEMLFFARTDPGAVQAEYWPNGGPPPPIMQAIELDRPQAAGFSSQSSATYNLTTARQILEKSPQYEVIEHLAWQQPGLSEAQARPVHIDAGPDYSPRFAGRLRSETRYPDVERVADAAYRPHPLLRLDGTVKISLDRYLHIYTDLIYRQPVDTPAGQTLIEARIRQERRMESGELYYLDHPLLGILVQITPVE